MGIFFCRVCEATTILNVFHIIEKGYYAYPLKVGWMGWMLWPQVSVRTFVATKARACKDASHEWSPGVTFHAPRSVEECEGMNPHSQVSSHFGSWSFNGLLNLECRGRLQRSKLIGLKCSLYHWKDLGT